MAQTHAEWELILVDNNSTDGTRDVLQRLKEKRPDRIQIYNEPKQGAPAARNTGLRHARGQWVQFLDADDELLPGKLSRQLQLARDDVSFVAGNYIYKTPKRTTSVRTMKDPFCGLIMSRLGITSANLFNHDYLVAVGGWNEDLSSSQEYDLMFRVLMLNGRIATGHAFDVVVHKTPGSIMTDKNASQRRRSNSLKLRLAIREYLIETDQFTMPRRYCFSAFVGTLLIYRKFAPPEPIEFNRFFYLVHRVLGIIRRRVSR